MLTRLPLLAATLCLIAACAPAGEVVLIENSRARAMIVLPAEAGPRSVEAGAARMLADHLALMSGARLDIRREDELGPATVEGGRLAFRQHGGHDTFILVGEGEAARRLGITSEGLGPGGIVMKTHGNVLTLLGPAAESDNAGTRHAVIELLESLGVRYLWPGETGRVVPKRETVAAGPFDVRFAPPIGQRRIRIARMTDRSLTGLARLQLTREEWDEAARQARAMEGDAGWTTWHRLGGNIGIGGGHAGAGLRGGWEEHGEEHPEWFALQADGTRSQAGVGNRWRLCKSNPALIEFVAADIVARLDENPVLRCVSLSPNDGGYSSHCMCEACKRLDPPEAPTVRFLVFEKVGQSRRHEIEYPALTDRMVWYWNQIAERVTKVHPDVLFLAEAYSLWSTPPVRERVHPNLVVRYVPSGTEGWEGWRQAGAKRIYWRPNILLAGRRDGMLHVMVDQLAETMQFMADRGMLATDFDSVQHHWSVHGLNYYAAARLNWNPHLTPDEILDSYCRPGFGEGAEAVKQYFLEAEQITADPERNYDAAAVGRLRKLLDAAERAAAGEDDVQARIAFLRMGLNFTELQATLDALTRQAAEKDPALDRERAGQLLELNYLTLRDIARNHNLVLHAANLLWATADYARWSPIGGRGYRPPPARLDHITTGGYSLTGREAGLEAMRTALGLDRVMPAPQAGLPQPRVPAGPTRTVMEADEEGRPAEMPAD